jgi:hypothetical protein
LSGVRRTLGPKVWAAALVLLMASGCDTTHSTGGAALETSTPASVPADLGADQLSGLAHAELTALLGAADFDRRDGPAEILQYRDGTCVLDVFLYRDSADAPFRVAYVEARDMDMSKVAGDDCLRSLRAARRNRAS